MARLTGKRALVTGAGGADSIGRGIVTELAAEGAHVVINDLEARRGDAEVLAEEIRAVGRRAFVIVADLSKVEGCRQLVAKTVEALGGLDILVNNAGGGKRAPFEQITEADYDHILNINLKAPFFMCQAAIPHLRAGKNGRIINIGSELGYNGLAVNAHYTAAKAAIRNLSKSLAIAFAPDVTVNTVCPGPTDTPRLRGTVEYCQAVLETIPLKRWGTPKDIGRSVVFLASSDGDAFTGQTLDPNVGMVMD